MSKQGINGYKILKTIGKGGMSTVYLGVQQAVGRMVAIKVLSKRYSEDKDFTQRFLKEANCGVLNHPNIITIHDAGESNGHLYIAMEYCDGEDLKQKIEKGLTEEEALRVMLQISSALSFAHKNNFVHRDIKPGNILFDDNGNAVLADFGIAKAVRFQANATSHGDFIGTPSYISPEQVSDAIVDHRSDLYSLGIVYFELLTGNKPFVADSPYALIFKHLKEPVPRLDNKYKKHQKIIDKLLEKEPENRYDSADKLLLELKKITPQEQPSKTKKQLIRNVFIALLLIFVSSSLLYSLFDTPAKPIPKKIVYVPSIDTKKIKKLEHDLNERKKENEKLEKKAYINSAISRHLTQAAEYIEIEQYVYPANRSAAHELHIVLNLDPKNIQAKTGLQSIINHYALLANNEINKHNYVNAIKYTKDGLKIDKKNIRLQNLQQQSVNLLKTKRANRRLKSELKSVNNLIKQKKYYDAKLKLEEIKKDNPNSKKVKNKLTEVNKHLRKKITELTEENKHTRKKQHINYLLDISIELLSITPVVETNLDIACENIHSILQLIPKNDAIMSLKTSCAYQYLLLSKKETSNETAIELVEKGLNYDSNSKALISQLNKLLSPSETGKKISRKEPSKQDKVNRFRSY